MRERISRSEHQERAERHLAWRRGDGTQLKRRSNLPAGKREVAHLEIYFVDCKTISDLHARFLNDPTPTDVITFHHGEIFICPAIAEKQRKATKLSLHDEVITYIIHGILHLCGYDDHSKRDFDRMRQKQEEILKIVS